MTSAPIGSGSGISVVPHAEADGSNTPIHDQPVVDNNPINLTGGDEFRRGPARRLPTAHMGPLSGTHAAFTSTNAGGTGLRHPGGPSGRTNTGPIDTSSTLVPGTAVTSTRFTIGPPNRPNIRHDNGFLQNPADPTDPTPIGTVSPGAGDYLQLAKWEAKLRAAHAIQGVPGVPHNSIRDGLAAYDHFLHGNGRDRNFSYERFVGNDPAGRTTLTNATRDTQLAAQQAYAQLLAQDPSLDNQPVTFQITGGAIGVGASSRFPYPDTENWQKAIGAHQIWTSATVTVKPPTTPGGQPRFEMTITLHAEDRYNFNPGAADIATGTPDAENGRFEQTGLAHQYMNRATLSRQVTWTGGNPEAGTSTRVGGR